MIFSDKKKFYNTSSVFNKYDTSESKSGQWLKE